MTSVLPSKTIVAVAVAERSLTVAFALVWAMLAVGAASASSGVVGHVYVNDNTAGVNTIGAFDRHADGSLTPMPGSPFRQLHSR